MGPKRTRMNPELFNRIIFLKRNSKMLPSIHPPVSNSANVKIIVLHFLINFKHLYFITL
jgi:hypothetical protein